MELSSHRCQLQASSKDQKGSETELKSQLRLRFWRRKGRWALMGPVQGLLVCWLLSLLPVRLGRFFQAVEGHKVIS